jgi:hypothetical protein
MSFPAVLMKTQCRPMQYSRMKRFFRRLLNRLVGLFVTDRSERNYRDQ